MDPGHAFEDEYLSTLDGSIQRIKHLADRSMVLFVCLRTALVVLSASLPALTVVPDRNWSTVAAVIVAALTGLDTQFRWGEEWRHFRSTQLGLQRMRRDFDRRKSLLGSRASVDGISAGTDNFAKLFIDVETLLQSEADRFFKFRITEWRIPEKPV